MTDASEGFERQIDICVAQIKLGHKPAFETLYQLAGSKLYGLLVKMTQDRDLAADVLQDSLVKIWQNASQYRSDLGGAWPWICQITRNTALDRLRQRARQPFSLEDVSLPEEEFDPLFHERDLGYCLNKLRQEPRAAIVQTYLYGLSHAELAAKWKQPLGTLKSWIRRGLKELEQCLKA